VEDLVEIERLALRLAAEAAEIHRRGLAGTLEVGTKATPTDMVTQIDREAERHIVAGIRATRPDDAILAEEETRETGLTRFRWVVDPLDGTTNYVYGYPAYAVSIGVEQDGEPVVGVVHDSARGEVFAGVKGRGATLDGRRISPRRHRDLATALLGTGFLPTPAERARLGVIAAHVLPRVRDLRRGGSAALDLCSVACGRLDAYYEVGLGEWDYCGGSAIASAAGAVVRRIVLPRGPSPLIVVANAELIEPLLSLLRDAGML